jgi:signal transduction histidine kinase
VAADVQDLADAFRDAVAGRPNREGTIEYRAYHRDGHIVWLESAPTTARNTAGVIVGVLDIVRDITARKIAEAELVEARQRAEVAAEAKTEFLANMSHELRTPLTSVIGFADALNDYCDLDEKARHFTTRVRSASRALLATVNDILDYAKIERGLVKYEFEFLPIRAHLEETLAIFAVHAREKKIALGLAISPSLDGRELLVDPLRLRQVLINLLGNALKFTDEGSVVLCAGYHGDTEHGRLRCEVVDTGPGIRREQMRRLFQRFSQIDGARNSPTSGAGLGLAICKGIVRGMEGEIGVTTDPGRGSTFWFELPTKHRRRPSNASRSGDQVQVGKPIGRHEPEATTGEAA